MSRLRLDGDFVLGMSCLVSLSKESTIGLRSIVDSLYHLVQQLFVGFAVMSVARPPSVSTGDAVDFVLDLTVFPEVTFLGTDVCRLRAEFVCVSQILALGAERDHDVVLDFHRSVPDEESSLLYSVCSHAGVDFHDVIV